MDVKKQTANRLRLFLAVNAGNEHAVRDLLAAGFAVDDAVKDGRLLHAAARRGHVGLLPLLLEAAPATIAAVDERGRTALHWALDTNEVCEDVEAARCLVQAVPSVQPTLGTLAGKGQRAASLYAGLVSRLALTQQEWQLVLAHCPTWRARCQPSWLAPSQRRAGWWRGWGRSSVSGCAPRP